MYWSIYRWKLLISSVACPKRPVHRQVASKRSAGLRLIPVQLLSFTPFNLLSSNRSVTHRLTCLRSPSPSRPSTRIQTEVVFKVRECQFFTKTLWRPIKILPPTTSPHPKLCFCTFRRKNCLLRGVTHRREFQNCYEICKVCGGLKIPRKIKRWTSSTSRLKISFHLKVKASPARYLMMIASHDRDRSVKIRENRNHARSASDHDEQANTLSASPGLALFSCWWVYF